MIVKNPAPADVLLFPFEFPQLDFTSTAKINGEILFATWHISVYIGDINWVVNKSLNQGPIMVQAKFTIDEGHIHFLNHHKKYGYKDKSAVIRAALNRLQKELEQEKLKMSADLYAKLYEEDKQLQELTESAIAEWPE